MTWKDFQADKQRYKESWERIKASYTGDMRHFLDESKIVVSAGRRFEIDADLFSAVQECPAFFITSLGKKRENDPSSVVIIDNWRVEVKFPYVDIDWIQELKTSPYCDRARTFMQPSSTCVVLLPVAEQ